MKRVLFLFFAIIMPLMAISSDITTFLGTWKCISSIDIVEGKEISNYMKGHYLQVNADGTYTSTSEEMGKGIYIVQGNSFVAQNESGATFTATISVAGNQLTMEGTSSYGVSFTYYFVKVEDIDVVGTWKCISSTDVVDGEKITNYMKGQYLTANSDGTYTSTSEEMGYGTYTLMGNTFVAKNNLGVSFTATVFVSGDQLTMEGSSSLGVSFQYIFERSNGEPEPDNPSGDPTKRSIHVANAGTLSDYISEGERNQIKELTLTGEINGTDLFLLRTMAGCAERDFDDIGKSRGDSQGSLVSLDLSDVKIVAGGDIYYYVTDYYGIDKARDFYIEEDNIIPAAAFVESNLREIILPTNITAIGEGAFLKNRQLTSITIPNSVVTIEGRAFSVCSSLTSITIPNSVTSIGQGAFSFCSGLTSITIPNSVTSIGQGAFYGCSSLTSITIPNSVTSIGSSAFNETPWYNNKPDGEVYAGKVFYKYKGTMPEGTKISIEDGTLGIAGSAFSDCSGLTSVTIPNSVTSIERAAFFGCRSLTSVTIPNSVTSIGDEAFAYCNGLTSVISEILQPFNTEKIFYTLYDDIYSNAILYVPTGTIDKYMATDGWKEFDNIVEYDLSGINKVKLDGKEKDSVYNLHGRRINQPQKGLNIIRTNDGKAKKVVVR